MVGNFTKTKKLLEKLVTLEKEKEDKKMGRKRINPKRVLTNIEKQRKIDDEAASIDVELEEAWKKIDWKRRISAEKSLIEFVNTYLIGLTLDEPPSLKG